MPNADQNRSRRRKQVLLGAAGLTALLGAGTIAAQQFTDDNHVSPGDSRALPATEAPAKSAVGASPSMTAATAKAAGDPSSSPSTLADRIAGARSANARAGTTVRRPLSPVNGLAVAAASDVTVTESGSEKAKGGTLRVVSARQDLTGQRELSWLVDNGAEVGDARCTNKVRFSAGAPAAVKPTLLLCFRISASKTVYTVAIDIHGRPSATASVAALDKQWSALG
jgi:hypothetical protein